MQEKDDNLIFFLALFIGLFMIGYQVLGSVKNTQEKKLKKLKKQLEEGQGDPVIDSSDDDGSEEESPVKSKKFGKHMKKSENNQSTNDILKEDMEGQTLSKLVQEKVSHTSGVNPEEGQKPTGINRNSSFIS